MPRPSPLAAALAAALALVLGASSARAGDPEIKFEKYKLPNGLTVILSEDHRLPQVAVNVWYHVGAANQTPGRSGFAHLFEHMMFSGSKHVQPSPFKVLETIGGVRQRHHQLRPDQLLRGGPLQRAGHGRLAGERPARLPARHPRRQKKLEVQRDVVSNERRQSYENRPYGLDLPQDLRPALPVAAPLLPVRHRLASPRSRPPRVEDVKVFFREFYGPQNASLAIVGDFDPAARPRRWSSSTSAPSRPAPPVLRPAVPQAQLTAVVRETMEDQVAEVPRLDLIWNGVKQYTDDEPAGDVLGEILAGVRHLAALTRSLVHDKPVAASVSAENSTAIGLGGWFP